MSFILGSSRPLVNTALRGRISCHYGRSFSISASLRQRRGEPKRGPAILSNVNSTLDLGEGQRLEPYETKLATMIAKMEETQDTIERKRVQADMAALHAQAKFYALDSGGFHYIQRNFHWQYWLERPKHQNGLVRQEEGPPAYSAAKAHQMLRDIDFASKTTDDVLLHTLRSLPPTLFAGLDSKVTMRDRIIRLRQIALHLLFLWPALRTSLTTMRAWWSPIQNTWRRILVRLCFQIAVGIMLQYLYIVLWRMFKGNKSAITVNEKNAEEGAGTDPSTSDTCWRSAPEELKSSETIDDQQDQVSGVP